MSRLDYFYGRPLLPLILMLGFIWVMGGMLNMIDVNAADGAQRYEGLIGTVWADGVTVTLPAGIGRTLYLSDSVPPNPVPGMAGLLHAVAPSAYAMMMTMAAFELLVGLSILSGFLAKYATLGGPLMNFAILLAAGHTHPGILRVNLLMLAAGLTIHLARHGKPYGLDKWMLARFPDSKLVQKVFS